MVVSRVQLLDRELVVCGKSHCFVSAGVNFRSILGKTPFRWAQSGVCPIRICRTIRDGCAVQAAKGRRLMLIRTGALLLGAILVFSACDDARKYPEKGDNDYDLAAMALTEADLPAGFVQQDI